MLQKWALSCSARNSHGTDVGPVEFCSTFYTVKMIRYRIMLDILHGIELGADEFFSTFCMEYNWSLLSSARHSSWYRNRRFPVLLDILNGSEVGPVYFCSIFFMVKKWKLELCSTFYMEYKCALLCSPCHCTWQKFGPG